MLEEQELTTFDTNIIRADACNTALPPVLCTELELPVSMTVIGAVPSILQQDLVGPQPVLGKFHFMTSFQSSGLAITMPPFEDLFEDVSSSLRIPPLKSMFPSPTTDRPIALEPYTSLRIDSEASRLTGRQMALAQAKTMDVLKPSDFEAMTSTTEESERPRINPLEEHNKKKRKLAHHEQLADFVHLPKPKPKLEEVNKKPFRPIAVLHQLNEPPPSAALFPPITPSQEEHERPQSDHTKNHGDGDVASRTAASGKVRQSKPSKPSQPKRNYTRPRRKWTEAETKDLKDGVAICGLGRWKDILEHPKFHFQEGRTYVDLKDRFRTLYPQNHSERWAEQCGEKPKGLRAGQTAKRKPLLGIRAPYRGWTEQEDTELDKGFGKHGFQWHLIAQDEHLHFNNRSANQIRDRFRRRHPGKYQEQPPAPTPETPNEKTSDNLGTRSKNSNRKSKALVLKISDQSRPSVSDNKESEKNPSTDPSRSDKAQPKATTAPTFPSGLLNGEAYNGESEFTRSLAALGDDLRLPPLQWDDMAVQPIFDLG